jgi:transcriptional regulator with XRE-family HTH domain
LLSDFELPNDSASKIESYRKLFNISKAFDVEAEVDSYENGLVELSDYTAQELSLLNIEIERRKEPYAQAQLKTRYKYYREKEVQEYSTFIENESKDDYQLCSFSNS